MPGLPKQQLTDHYIQLEILVKLAQSVGPVRFSDLKDPGIENSLFMYHANKLLNRGLITKHESKGFELTPRGAAWINFVGFKNFQPVRSPRLLVQFVIMNDAQNILLSKRTGSMGALLNDYMLPGGLYKYSSSADENAATQLRSFIADPEANLKLLTIAETLQGSDDVYHSVSYIYQVTSYDATPASDDSQYELVWYSPDLLTASNADFNNSPFIPEFITRFKNGLQPHELFTLE